MERAFIKLALSATLGVGVGVLACSSDSSATRDPAEGIVRSPAAALNAPSAPAANGQNQCSDDVDPKAAAALSKMAQFLGQAQTITFSAQTMREDVSSSHQKLQFDTNIKGSIKRPNKAFIEKTGAENVSLWFDGTTATILDRNTNKFLQVDAGDLDTLMGKLDDLDIETPFDGLLRSDIEKTVAEFSFQGDDYGPTLVGDRPCEHLAFRQDNIDWQLWIDQETNAPRKLVITSKMLALAPQQYLFVKDLAVNEPIDDSVFKANLPKGAEEATNRP
jgi:hypothetical protein